MNLDPEIPGVPSVGATGRYLAEKLRGGTPSEALAALSAGDVFHLTARSTLRLRERAFLMDPEVVQHRLLAKVAYAICAVSYETLEDGFTKLIDQSIDEIVAQEREEVARGNATLEQWDTRYEFFVYSLAIAPEKAREASVAFNAKPEISRKAFFQLIMVGKTPERCIAEGYGDRDTLRERVLSCFRALFGWTDEEQQDRAQEEKK